MNIGLIAGTISTSIFMLSQIPMLLKAVKTRSLYSYSFSQISMNTGANLIHWCYISTLPFGPIWILHSFSTISTALMLLWYMRYEKRGATMQSALSSALFDNKLLTQEHENAESGKELSGFHIRFRAYSNSIYRGALILTGNPKEAEKLQIEIYIQAFICYLQMEPEADIEIWLMRLVEDSFAEWKTQNVKRTPKDERKHELALQAILPDDQ